MTDERLTDEDNMTIVLTIAEAITVQVALEQAADKITAATGHAVLAKLDDGFEAWFFRPEPKERIHA